MRIYLGTYEKSFEKKWEGTVHQYKDGQVIMDSINAGQHVGLITEGLAKMRLLDEMGKEKVICFLRPLSLFGEVTIFSNKKLHPCVEIASVTPVKVIYLTKEDIARSTARHPELTTFLLKALSDKVSSLLSQINGISFQSTLTMICDVLLAVGEMKTEICLTHEELANIVGRNRVTVTRVLLKLQEMGIIEQKRGRILVSDLEGLESLTLLQEGENIVAVEIPFCPEHKVVKKHFQGCGHEG